MEVRFPSQALNDNSFNRELRIEIVMSEFSAENVRIVIESEDGDVRELLFEDRFRHLFMPALEAIAAETDLVAGPELPLCVDAPCDDHEHERKLSDRLRLLQPQTS